MAPFPSSAHVNLSPAAISVAKSFAPGSSTLTGVYWSVASSPEPRLPFHALPQHHTAFSESIAQLWYSPMLIFSMIVSCSNVTGVNGNFSVFVDPIPFFPLLLFPQQ